MSVMLDEFSLELLPLWVRLNLSRPVVTLLSGIGLFACVGLWPEPFDELEVSEFIEF